MNRLGLSLGLVVLAPIAAAQSVNIDFDSTAGGAGTGAPPASYGGAANRPGFWNSIHEMNQTVPLVNWLGIPIGVTLDMQGAGTMTSIADPRSSGDMEHLLEDGFVVPTLDDTLFFNFQGLQAGPYLVYTYCRHPDSSERETRLTVGILNQRDIGGSMYYANQFAEGITHDRRIMHVGASGNLHVEIRTNPDAYSPNGFIAGFQLVLLPTRLYVNAAAPAGGDGRSWESAFTDLHEALDQCAEWFDGVEEIWVAQGNYLTSTASSPNRSDSFQLVPRVAVYGGFTGVETSLAQRDPVAHPTILTGNIGGPLSGDNAYCVVQSTPLNFADGDPVLDGFTIIGGNGGYASSGFGAGLYCYRSSPIIRNCRFLNNTAASGAAVSCRDSSPTFVGCEFRHNTASDTGGAYSEFDSNATDPASNATFVNCRFFDNDGGLLAGAVSLERGVHRFVNCLFTGNDAGAKGGAIFATGAASLTVANCSIVGNTSQINGAGLTVENGALLQLHNSILWDNHAAATYEGTLQSQVFLLGSTSNVSYTTVQFFLPILLSGPGNNGLNPGFVDATGGDGYGQPNDNLRLLPASPMIDAGDNVRLPFDLADLDGDGLTWQEPTPWDLDGQARRIDDPSTPDHGSGAAPIVDRGAYEFGVPPQPCEADFNGDGTLNSQDFFDFLSAFFSSVPAADVNADGIINSQDFFDFLTAFFSGC
ncbi:MAG: GC-type dockerin domain-anchored protein [Phycisphaerales bacterium]